MGMLILSRKIGESIQIGDDVRVVFLGYRDARGYQFPIAGVEASIGIEAPKSITILREELLQATDKEGADDV